MDNGGKRQERGTPAQRRVCYACDHAMWPKTFVVHYQLDFCNCVHYKLPKSQISRLQQSVFFHAPLLKLLNTVKPRLSEAFFSGLKQVCPSSQYSDGNTLAS